MSEISEALMIGEKGIEFVVTATRVIIQLSRFQKNVLDGVIKYAKETQWHGAKAYMNLLLSDVAAQAQTLSYKFTCGAGGEVAAATMDEIVKKLRKKGLKHIAVMPDPNNTDNVVKVAVSSRDLNAFKAVLEEVLEEQRVDMKNVKSDFIKTTAQLREYGSYDYILNSFEADRPVLKSKIELDCASKEFEAYGTQAAQQRHALAQEAFNRDIKMLNTEHAGASSKEQALLASLKELYTTYNKLRSESIVQYTEDGQAWESTHEDLFGIRTLNKEPEVKKSTEPSQAYALDADNVIRSNQLGSNLVVTDDEIILCPDAAIKQLPDNKVELTPDLIGEKTAAIPIQSLNSQTFRQLNMCKDQAEAIEVLSPLMKSVTPNQVDVSLHRMQLALIKKTKDEIKEKQELVTKVKQLAKTL